MKPRYRMISLLFLSLGLGGCATETCLSIPSNQNSTSNSNLGSGLFGSIAVTPSASKLAGDLLYAKVSFFNKTNKTQTLRYQFQWFGIDGFNQGNPTPWVPLELLPNMSKVVSSIAPTQETTQYNVNVCYK